MLHGNRLLLLALVTSGLCACGSDYYNSETGMTTAASGTVAPLAAPPASVPFSGQSSIEGSHDMVIATPSTSAITVAVGASTTVSVTFTSSDGLPMSGFSVSAIAGGMPTGWSGPAAFTCAALTTGSNCVLNLQYAPTAVDSGTLTIDYVVIDDSGLAKTNGSTTIAYTATPGNNVVATSAPSGEIDASMDAGSVSVKVNFATDDGNPATNLVITSNLSALPAGWSAAGSPATTSCPIVSTGNGCQLGLTYNPSTTGSGTLMLTYTFTDDTGTQKSGSLNVPYRSTGNNVVIATASPTGQVTAVQKTGSRSVPITFTTDDGKRASGLAVSTDLTKLPAGWSSATQHFGCAAVATGSGCQLPLVYAPNALGGGTLTLNYSYVNGEGSARSGSLNIPYTATSSDSVVATTAPGGEINAVIGQGNQPVSITFTTDDARPATALQVTSDLAQLPAGWSSPVSSYTCSGIDADTVCKLTLTYAPTTAGSGTLDLDYSYLNNAGEAKTGTAAVMYRSTTNDTIVGVPDQTALTIRTGSTTTVTIAFATDDGNVAGPLTLTTDLTALPPGWASNVGALTCPTVNAGTACTLSLTYAPTAAAAGALSLGFSYTNDAGYAKTGSVTVNYTAVTPYLYVANAGSNSLSVCPLNVDDSVAACSTTGGTFSGPTGVVLDGNYAYIANSTGNSVSRCTQGAGGVLSACAASGGLIAGPTFLTVAPSGTQAYVGQAADIDVCTIATADGSLSGCTATAATFAPLAGLVLSADGTHAYSVGAAGLVEVCAVGGNGALGMCTPTAPTLSQALATLALQNGRIYVSTAGGTLAVCSINADATVGACASTTAGSNPQGIAFFDGKAYVSTNSGSVLTCPVNGDGSFAACTNDTDPTFNGTSGLIVR